MSQANEEYQVTPALEGIRVIDAASLAAAPMAAAILAEFGADVIKVEDPNGGDPARRWGDKRDGIGLFSKSLGRNKRSVTIDLRLEVGQALLRRLAERSDVIIVNARPSTLVRWGLTYEKFRESNPKIIMLHLTGFGAGGPASDRPGFGTLGEAMSGFAHLTGQPEGPPTLPPLPLADGVASLTAVYAIMMALYHREAHDGEGQLIDVNLIEPLARLLEHNVLAFDQLGVVLQRFGNQWGVSAPRNTYRTADDRWLAMSGSTSTIVRRVFEAIGRPELADDPRFIGEDERLQHAGEIDRLVATWVATRSLEEAMTVFVEHEVAAAPVYDAEQLLADPHLKARGTFVTLEDEQLGPMTVQGPVPRMSGTPGRVSHLGRDLGADNDEVFREVLEISEAELGRLRRSGAIN